MGLVDAMKPRTIPATSLLAALLTAGAAAPAVVVVGPPASATEPISGAIQMQPLDLTTAGPRFRTADALPPDLDPSPERARFVFPNVSDPLNPKELSFVGEMQFAPDHVPPNAATVGVNFGWFDPSDPSAVNGWVTSDTFVVQVNGTDPVPVGPLEYTIPFCPPQVSIEFSFLDAHVGAHVLFTGDFTHTCVPEPSSTAAAFGMALAGFALWRRQRAG